MVNGKAVIVCVWRGLIHQTHLVNCVNWGRSPMYHAFHIQITKGKHKLTRYFFCGDYHLMKIRPLSEKVAFSPLIEFRSVR